MKVYMSGKDLMIEGATNENILGGNFRNFAGLERKNQGRIVNTAGTRCFNLRIPEDQLQIFQERNCNIKMYGGNEEENESPIYFVKVNVKTDSKQPPQIYLLKANKKMQRLDPEMYYMIDGMFIETCDMVMNFYRRDYNDPDCKSTLYLNAMYIKQHVDPITAKWDAMMEADDLDPNLPDADFLDVPGQDEGAPF